MTKHVRVGPLFTDLYELTMAASYFDEGITARATFSLFIRGYHRDRGYYVAAGLEDALRELKYYRFTDDEIAYLRSTGLFSAKFLSFLSTFSFSGEIHALPEGSLFFADEPILEVTAPMIEAQIVETFLINTVGFQTLIASKAARCICAAQGRPLIDFSLRRTQGQDAGMKVARSSYIAGFSATSNVLAGKHYGIPTSGTMAHSYVMAFESEQDAFAAYARTFPDKCIFLVDTFDTLQGARAAIAVAQEMKKHGHQLIGVRLDSGDMAELSKKVRHLLNEARFPEVRVIASSGFDEKGIAAVLARGGQIDGFGVGTRMGVSADAPYLDIVYKLVRFNDRDVKKLSTDKVTLAGKKQVFRKRNKDGFLCQDIIGTREEVISDSEPLLQKVMEEGKTLHPFPSLDKIRQHFQKDFSQLDNTYKALYEPATYPVRLSRRLAGIQKKPLTVKFRI